MKIPAKNAIPILLAVIVLGGGISLSTGKHAVQAFPLVAPDKIESWNTAAWLGNIEYSDTDDAAAEGRVVERINGLEEVLKTAASERPKVLQIQGSLIAPLRDNYSGAYGTTDYGIYMAIADQYVYLGKGDLAYEYLQKAIATDPNGTVAYLRLGDLMTGLGGLATANAAYKKAIEIEPASVTSHKVYANFLFNAYTGNMPSKTYSGKAELLQDITEEVKNLESLAPLYKDDVGLFNGRSALALIPVAIYSQQGKSGSSEALAARATAIRALEEQKSTLIARDGLPDEIQRIEQTIMNLQLSDGSLSP